MNKQNIEDIRTELYCIKTTIEASLKQIEGILYEEEKMKPEKLRPNLEEMEKISKAYQEHKRIMEEQCSCTKCTDPVKSEGLCQNCV